MYYFTPGVPKESFDLLIELFTQECEKRNATIPQHFNEEEKFNFKMNFGLKDCGEKVTVDCMHEDGVRITYDQSDKPIAIIKKHKLKHINYYSRGKDYRISISVEQDVEKSESQKVVNRRHKRRRTFEFKWIRFEFTETCEKDPFDKKSKPVYEIEAEICNNAFFNNPDNGIYSTYVFRFIQNIDTLLDASKNGIDKYFEQIVKPELTKAYQETFGGDTMPIVGDYLPTKAYYDKNT